MSYFRRSGNPRANYTLKNHPAYGMKYPGVVNSVSHRIANWRQIQQRAQNPEVKKIIEKIIEKLYEDKQKLVDPSGNASDYLGESVAISNNGTYIVGGAVYDDIKGSLVVFELKEKQ